MINHMWLDKAACRGHDPEAWFPVNGGPMMPKDTQRALEICDACEVRFECMLTAMREKIEHGIWGGFTPEQRKELEKRFERRRKPLTENDLRLAQ